MAVLRNVVLVGVGAANITKEKAEQLIDTLIRRGEEDQSDGKDTLLMFVDETEEKIKRFSSKLSDQAMSKRADFVEWAKDMKWAKASEIQKLEDRISQLEEELRDLRGDEKSSSAKNESPEQEYHTSKRKKQDKS